MNSNIAIIIVTYNPNLNIINNVVKELTPQNDIYISDNGSNNFKDIKNNYKSNDSVYIINNRENLGIGKAQNIAISLIEKQKKYKYTFYLDQDSFITQRNLYGLKEDYKKLEKNCKNIASISAVEKDDFKKYKFVNETISSGMLIPIKVFKKVGLMKESFFIDMVDYEWCWRAKKYGYIIIQDYDYKFIHQIGSTKRVLNKIPISPFRLYYVYRNIIFLLRVDYLPKGYKGKLRKKLIKQFIYNGVFCNKRIIRIKFILKGIYDGKRNIYGKLK